MAKMDASWAPRGGSLPCAQRRLPGRGSTADTPPVTHPSSCSRAHLLRPVHPLPRGREGEGRLSPTSCFLRPGTTPHLRTPVLFSPPSSNLSLSCRQNTGCAMGPTGNVYPRQPRSPRRKLSRWAQAWGRGTVCRLLDEWAPQPVRPHLHPSLPKGGGQTAPWPPPHPLFLCSPCPPPRPLARRWRPSRVEGPPGGPAQGLLP